MTDRCHCGSAARGICAHCGRPACSRHTWADRPSGERRYYDHDTGVIAVEPVYASPLPPGRWRADQQAAMFEAVGTCWATGTFICRECVERVMIAAATRTPASAAQPSLAHRIEHALDAGDVIEWHALISELRDAWALNGEIRRLVMRFVYGASRGALGPEHRCGVDHRPYQTIVSRLASPYGDGGGVTLRAHWGVGADGQIMRCEQRAGARWTVLRRTRQDCWSHRPDPGTHIARYVDVVELVARQLTAGLGAPVAGRG